MKRIRNRRAKPGQLIAFWGNIDGAPDLCFAWGGSGASKSDTALLHYVLAGKHPTLIYGEDRANVGREWDWGMSFIEDLERRGYDISTIRFSIEQRAMPTVGVQQ